MTVEARERATGPGPESRERAASARTVIKICGLTNLDDARAARDAGADWLGFVHHPPSPRHVEPERASEIVAALGGVPAVAVMVATSPERALAIASRIGATRIQMHRPPAEWPSDFPLPTTMVVTVSAAGELTAPLPEGRHLVMLDTAHAELAGGTGETFPWEAARRVADRRPVLLAGGLSAGNVREALERVRPFGVDASSVLERSPGLKDHARVRAFVLAVRGGGGA